MRDTLTYRLPGWKEMNEGLQFWNALQQLPNVKPKIYFDSAGGIDMLTGTGSIFKGNVLQAKLYSQDANLVYALAYRKWLGEIYMLPPHTEEFIESLQFNDRLFPDSKTQEPSLQNQELWHRILETKDLARLKDLLYKTENPENIKVIEELQKNPYHLFLGIYLTRHGNYWKGRYKYLVKEEKILQFSHETDYSIGDVTNQPLFEKVLRILNGKRTRTANNYIDALALSVLDAKLEKSIDNEDRPIILPLFFSNQGHILETVEEIRDASKPGERIPFTYIDLQTGKHFPIVRAASFFIIEGFVNAMRENKQAVEKFQTQLADINRQFESGQGKDGADTYDLERFKNNYLEPEIHKQVMLEFFERWWGDGGYHEIVGALALQEDQDQEEVNEQVKQHIEEVRLELKQNFEGLGARFKIIRDAWQAFFGFAEYLDQDYIQPKAETTAFHDFGPRLNYSESVCNRIQKWISRAIDAVSQKDNDELKAVEGEVITHLIRSLFEGINEKEDKDEQLDQLTACLGFFYFFNKCELVVQVCDEVRRQYEHVFPDSPDKYPVPSIALIHAAALLQGRNEERKVEEEVLDILKCLESKAQKNYKVWIGLSYIYNLLWIHRMHPFGVYKFRELFRPEEFYEDVLPSRGYQYLAKAIDFSQAAMDYIREELSADEKLNAKEKEKLSAEEKQQLEENAIKRRPRWQKLYYAMNNYLFFKTLYSSPEEFAKLESYKDKLAQTSPMEEYYHEGRFSDTLARYFLRSAILAESDYYFKLDLEDALDINNRAIRSSPKQLYQDLHSQIKHWMTRKTYKDVLKQRQLFEDYLSLREKT